MAEITATQSVPDVVDLATARHDSRIIRSTFPCQSSRDMFMWNSIITLLPMPPLRRSLQFALVIAVVLAMLPALSAVGSPPTVHAMQPATPIASQEAGEFRIRDLQDAAHHTTREGQVVTDLPGIVTALRPEGN